mgnify:CR=1 FL=1
MKKPQLHESNQKNCIGELYRLKKAEMISYSYSICKNMEMAEDVIQTTFVTLLLKKDFYKIRDLYSYAIQCVKFNTLKQIKIRSKFTSNDKNEDTYNIFINNHYYCHNNKSYDFLKEQIIIDAINDLPRKRKTVFIMKRIEKRSVKDISRELSISPKTVENHITNSIRDLRNKIGPN